ncbi:hypothetical protein [Reinekea sp. G2M2-21]|uniref:hypothetical protein n=1 Tax=Reinekea sp. G2M2-21 TaxID=2788942 RepID=UPI0018AB2681|nr:hypothetical protein [Reinekea sp. G2M2-21]
MDANCLLLHKAKQLTKNDKGFELVKKAINSEPARRVKASKNGKNYAIRFPSRKMAAIIQAESSTIEFPKLLEAENKSKILGIFDQPPQASSMLRNRQESQTQTKAHS